jgi:hypothetical protein
MEPCGGDMLSCAAERVAFREHHLVSKTNDEPIGGYTSPCKLPEDLMRSSGSPVTPVTSAPSTPASSQSDCEEHGEEIALCSDQAQWLEQMATEHYRSQGASLELADGLSAEPLGEGACLALQRLIDIANREPPKTKRQIFLVVRCRRCLQHTRGGAKKDYFITLPQHHWMWLEGVQVRCKHASIGKTLRIIIDFYKPVCEADADFAANVFAKSEECSTTSDEHSQVLPLNRLVA